jgi:hypothetical protein
MGYPTRTVMEATMVMLRISLIIFEVPVSDFFETVFYVLGKTHYDAFAGVMA